MPIKWKQFEDTQKPFQIPDMPNQEDWTPFIPHFKAEEPIMDIYQDKINLYVEIPLINIKPKDVKISIEDNILTIEGKTEKRKEIKGEEYFRKEIRRGSFKRSVKLPVQVKDDKAQAESINGILKITIPKVAKSASKGKEIVIKIK